MRKTALILIKTKIGKSFGTVGLLFHANTNRFCVAKGLTLSWNKAAVNRPMLWLCFL